MTLFYSASLTDKNNKLFKQVLEKYYKDKIYNGIFDELTVKMLKKETMEKHIDDICDFSEVCNSNDFLESNNLNVCFGRDKDNNNVVLDLRDLGNILVGVKYTESAFGGTQSKKFKELHKKYHSNVEINNDDYSNYKKYYQFIRNACLGIDGNYTVFLFPKSNTSIAKSYKKAKENIVFKKPVEVGCLYWENIIKEDMNDIFYRKYFANALEMEEYYKNKSITK